MNWDTIPTELRTRQQWIVWRYETRQGKATKVPYQVGGKRASVDDPATWTSFDEARAAVDRLGMDGIGFVFAAGGGVVGIDLDHCRDPQTGAIEPWARRIIERVNSYAEISPSGTGVHILVLGTLPPGRRRKGAIELYGASRFFTVTGDHLGGTPTDVLPRQDALEALHAEIFGAEKERSPSGEASPVDVDDAELLERARRAANGADFERLWRGDIIGYPSQSEADLALCSHLVFWTGGDPQRVDRLFRQSGLYRPKWDERHFGDGRTYGEATIEKALAGARDFYRPHAADKRRQVIRETPSVATDDDDHCPRINAGDKDLTRVTQEAWAALVRANDPPFLFRHGGIPSRLEHDDQGAPIIRELTPDRMRYELARWARWYTEREENGETIREVAKPPMDVVRNVLATPDPPLPILQRIVEAPTFAPDGTLQTAPGYHAAARTYYQPAPHFTVPPVPDQPTPDDIERARGLILELLHDFPFESDADRAHAVGLFLLPFARDLIAGPTPNHLIEAPTPGSGKGLLADVLLRPSVGRNIGVIPEARDDDEWRKRITARLVEARAVVLVDNVTRPLDSGVLAAALTALTWEDRILAKSATVSVPVRCVWVTTANNPVLSTELARRSIRIRLDPRVDRPWLREGFRHPDLRGWADENRANLVWAALTLIRAWLATGRPQPDVKPLGSFEQWSAVIGGILQVAGIPGFLANLAEFYEVADLEGAVWRAFVTAWWERFQENEVTAADLFPLALQTDGLEIEGRTERAQRIAFGKKLGKQRDRVIGDYRIVQTRTVQRAAHWRLLPTRLPLEQAADHVNVVNVSECSLPIAPRAREKRDGRDEKYTESGDIHQHSQHSHLAGRGEGPSLAPRRRLEL